MLEDVHNLVSTLILLGVVCAAAVFDWRTRKIPNQLIVMAFIAACVLAFSSPNGDSIRHAAIGFGVGFLLLLPGFVLGFTGAGDVKLFVKGGSLERHARDRLGKKSQEENDQ